jgi:hypothetical protein
MAKELPFFRALNLKALFGRKAPQKASEKTLAPTTSGRLRSILPVIAYRSGNSEPIRLLCGRLSTSGMVFRTTTCIQEEECLEIEFLLQGAGTMKIMAQVRFVALASEVQAEAPPSQSSLGTVKPIRTYSGQLELWTTPSQQEQILSYLCREHEQARVSTSG